MNFNSYKSILATGILTLSIGVQAQTQKKMEEIVLPKPSPECTEQTKLIVPKGSDWSNSLKEFSTCTAALTIKVLPDNTLEINEGNSVWIGKLEPHGSIERIKNIK